MDDCISCKVENTLFDEGRYLRAAQQRSLYTGVAEVAESRLESEQAESGSYLVLAVTYAALAACACLFPASAADLLIGSRPGGHTDAVLTLMRLLPTGFATASFVSFTLKQALAEQPISQRKFERLNLGLSAFATLNLLLLVTSLASPEGSIHFPLRPGFWAAALAYLLTMSMGWGQYAPKTGIRQTVKNSIPNLPAIKQDVQNVISTRMDSYFPNSYTVITLSLVVWGLAQFFVPWEMLDLLIQNDGGAETELMGRLLSCGMITLLPAVSYSLKEVAKDEAIRQQPSRTLNAGLAAAALLNVSVLTPFMAQGKGGVLLAAYLALWSATLVTSGRSAMLSSTEEASEDT